MSESLLLCIYAVASLLLATWVRSQLRIQLDWYNPRMRRPMSSWPVRTGGGSGAIGAADAVTTGVLSNATPAIGMMAFMAVGSLLGGAVGGAVLPALAGGVAQPGMLGTLALMAATLSWMYVGARLTAPLLFLALALFPLLAVIGVVLVLAQAMWSNLHLPMPDVSHEAGRTWQASFDARVDYNMCVVTTGMLALGSQFEIDRRCKPRVVGASAIEGRFAGIFACGGAKHSAAIITIRPFRPEADGTKSVQVQYSVRPEQEFPTGEYAGYFSSSAIVGSFKSDGLSWTQRPAGNDALPKQMTLAPRRDGTLSVNFGGNCAAMVAKRCEVPGAGRVADCVKEFAAQGVKLYVPRTLKELDRWIQEGRAREARAQ